VLKLVKPSTIYLY